MTASKSASAMPPAIAPSFTFTSRPSRRMPALFTRTSIRPCVVASFPTASRTALTLVTSTFMSAPSRTSQVTTVAPASWNTRAVSAPMPRPPPVMTATRPSSRNIEAALLTRRPRSGRRDRPHDAERPRAQHPRAVAQRRPQSSAEREHDDHENDAGDDAGRLGRAREGVAQQQHDGGAGNAAPEGPDAAEDGHEHGRAGRRPVQQIERCKAVSKREERTRETCEAARQHEGEQLVTPRRVAEGLRTRLVVADRHEHVAKRRVHDPPGEREAEEHERQRRVVELDRASHRDARKDARHTLHTVLAAGHRTPLVRHVEEHLRERERDHREVDRTAPDREEPERDCEERGAERAEKRRDR